MEKFTKPVIFYIDDLERNIDSFKYTCEQVWKSNYLVKSNSRFGKVTDEESDEFIRGVLQEMKEHEEGIKCVLLDLDYTGEEEVPVDNNVRIGLQLGHIIRKKWPFLPIFVASRFADQDIVKKGLMYDFEYMDYPETFNDMSEAEFVGLIKLAEEKRGNILKNLPNIPIAYMSGEHEYFHKKKASISYEELVFIAMPFNRNIISKNTEHAIINGIKDANLKHYKVDEDIFNNSIMDNITSHIFGAKYIVADITSMNPNVMFELGLAMSANKKCIILLNADVGEKIPFDLSQTPIIKYSSDDSTSLQERIKGRLTS